MGYIIKMPKLGLEMERGIVLEWRVDEGDAVEEGDVLVEVESEKSIGEVDAREDGALRRIYVEEDGEVPPGTPIGILAAPDADISDLEAEVEAELEAEAPDAGAASDASASPGAEATPEANAAAGSEAAAAQPSASGSSEGASGDVTASPRARKRAAELEVDLTTVEGTGPMGSITEDDVEAAAESAAQADADAAATAAEQTDGEEIKASPRARTRAAELEVDLTTVEGTGPMGSITEGDVEAAAESATAAEAAVEVPAEPSDVAGVRWLEPGDPLTDRYHRTTAVAAPAAASALFETIEAVRTAFEEAVTMTDVLVVLASATLAERPVLNGTYADDTHHVRESQNVALVADSGGEPVSVVVSDAANRSLAEVVEARRTADGGDADAAAVTETDRPTFTVANAAEIDANGRLVNPPSVATLEVDPTGQRAVPDGEDVTLRPLVVATLTYDARAIGSSEAAAFLEHFFERTERASELVLGSYRGRE